MSAGGRRKRLRRGAGRRDTAYATEGDAPPAGDAGRRLCAVVDALGALALRQREAARARGDYASADSIRDSLGASRVVIEDTLEGTRWELAR